jgi:two-component system chemotaxis response regulator CheB
MTTKKIKVLIVDDSAVVREALRELFDGDPEIVVMDTAGDPFIAVEKIAIEVPDVMILDIEMPRMDGLTFLQKIMTQHPIPVIICSSLVGNGCETAMKALEYGAVEIVAKPNLGTKTFFMESRVRFCDLVKAVAGTTGRFRLLPQPKLSADAVLKKKESSAMLRTTEKVVVVGASTGGTEALRVFLEAMPIDCPGIIIVQHMPEKFTASFAQRLDRNCKIAVKEAENQDSVLRGQALIAPGNKHILVKRSGARYLVETRDGPLVSRHRPSVDVLFRSASRFAGKNAVGVIMTGMGDDGAKGMLEMKQTGAYTIAQDEASSIVYGMPRKAAEMGGVEVILPLEKLAEEVLRVCTE